MARRPVWLDAAEIATLATLLERALTGGSVPERDQDICDCLRALFVDPVPWLTVDDEGRALARKHRPFTCHRHGEQAGGFCRACNRG